MHITSYKLLALAAPELSDGELLVRFASKKDAAAFEEIVRRHGPAVLRVCRRLVGPSAADDAFQAVFLVLACRAESVRKADSIGSWLIGVAGRVARQMLQQIRRRQEASLGSSGDRSSPSLQSPDCRLAISELSAALDEELTRLPDSLRAPVVLCLVEGRTQQQAAAELGGSLRTLRRRLDRAKSLLRVRLERRGIVPAVAAALVGNMQSSSALPPLLLRRTVEGVFEFLAGGPGVQATPAVIAKGVIASMATFKVAVLMPVAACVLVGLGAVWAQDPVGKGQQNPALPQKIDVPPAIPSDEKVVEHHVTEIKTGTPIFHRSANFVVHSVSPTMARAVAAEAEYQRLELAKLWLGKELPTWEKPCEIEYLSLNNTDNGTIEFDFGTQKDGCARLSAIRISLNGDLDKCLENGVPHNVMLAVITSGLGEALPKWAMRGLARTDDHIKVQQMLNLHCRDILNAGRGIRLRALLPMKAAIMNSMDMEFQGHSVVRFLLAQKGTVAPAVLKDLPQVGRFFQNEGNEKQRFVAFLHVGLENNTLESWNRAAKLYGFESVDALEEAWLQYLRKPESRLVPQTAPPVPVPPKPIDPNTIPPTKLPVGNTYLNRG